VGCIQAVVVWWGVNRGGSGLFGVDSVAVWDGRDNALLFDVVIWGWGVGDGCEEGWRCDDAVICRRRGVFRGCVVGLEWREAGALGVCC